MNLQQVLLVLRARWLVVVSLFLAVVIAVAALTLLSQKQYTATASVVVDAKTDPVAGIVYPSQLLSSYIATQVDIISSERVAKRVIKDLKLDQSPQAQDQWREATGGRGDFASWLAGSLQKRLLVLPSRESDVINISVTLPDPKGAAALANAFAQAYIDTNIELKVDPAREYAAWFDERSRSLRADLETKHKKLSDYQKQNGLIATDERLDIENARLTELSTQLVAIQGVRQDSQSRQRQVSGDNDSLPEVLQSGLVSGLKAGLSQEEAKLKDIATNLGKNHPDYQTTQATITSLRERIDQETANIVASLNHTTQANVRRESDIRAALDAQKKLVLGLKHQHDEATDLENDVLAAQKTLDAVIQRQAQSSLESQTQQTNAVLLTPATEPLVASKPRVFFNLLAGLFLGGVLGVGVALLLELSNRKVRTEDELIQLLRVPLLGKVALSPMRERRALPWLRPSRAGAG
jgi:chain length determinant protein EpsF